MKTVVITGSSRGLGYRITPKFECNDVSNSDNNRNFLYIFLVRCIMN